MISASVALRLLLPLSAITVAATDTQIRLQPIDTQVDIEGVATAASSQGKNSIIQWGKCNDSSLDNTIPVDCGHLELPLDYTDLESNSTLNLALLRVPAATQPAKGSIILNFGGPGVPGRESLASAGQLLQMYLSHLSYISGGLTWRTDLMTLRANVCKSQKLEWERL